ncbi:MAG: mandelate racemase/muconate lactonizing enzyme family protein [Acidobacteriaceae bacterium]|nr:mandelate racemase/muconate lactonizing enzyme family protein [Acidobacteriaceae bacterium]
MSLEYEDYKYRVPIKFGGTVLDRATIINVRCTVRTVGGQVAKGFGSMPMGNVWAFPSHTMNYETTLGAMKALASKICKITADSKVSGHPIDINWTLQPEYLKAASQVSNELHLSEPIPKLCALVTTSAFDAAVHDAFGKVHNLNCYYTYGPEFMTHDLSYYAGSGFRGMYPDRFLLKEPKPRMPLYHLVSAVDPIEDSDITKRVNDGLPETLPEWINHDGLTHLKIKLNGNDLQWDVERVLRIDRVTTETQKKRGVTSWVYSLDFNEKCPNIEYFLDFIKRIKERAPESFHRIQYIEQPFSRDMETHRQSVAAAAKLVPVVIDEALTGIDALMLARELGYTGAALKACKGQSDMMIIAPVAEYHKMFLCVQDLTCPGASFIQSASLAAHVPGVQAIEGNARQYMPNANQAWASRFPGLFQVKDGTVETAHLDKLGLGAV